VTGTPRDAEALPVRVQVIDLYPQVVDLVVPTFLPARDLTQRIVRDAGLGAWWEDGRRRTYALRARGKVLADDECLADLEVTAYELLHLLPEPRAEGGVVERPLEWPADHPLPLSMASKVWRVLGLTAWFVLWTLASYVSPGMGVAWFGALVTQVLAAGAVRAALPGSHPGVTSGLAAGFGLVLAWPPCLALWLASPVASAALVWGSMVMLGTLVGAGVAHLVWLGPVEPLTVADRAMAKGEEVETQVHSCHLCREEVAPDVAALCRYGCGRVMHSGCLSHRTSMAKGDDCEVCGIALR
jgi:hypothetical protein